MGGHPGVAGVEVVKTTEEEELWYRSRYGRTQHTTLDLISA